MKKELFWLLLATATILCVLVLALPHKGGYGLFPLALIALTGAWYANPNRGAPTRRADAMPVGVAAPEVDHEETPRDGAIALFEHFGDEIAMMVMLARADGRLTAEERAFIAETVRRHEQATDTCPTTLDDLIKGIRSGDAKFRLVVDRLARTRNQEHLLYFYRHSKALLDSSGKSDPICAGNLEYCRQAFRIEG